MAIVKMNKFTLLTFHRHKGGLLKELQKFGDVHFRKLSGEELSEMEFLRADSGRAADYESELEKVKFAISKISPYVQKPKGLKGLTAQSPKMSFEELDAYIDSFDYNYVYNAVREQDDRINAFKSEISRLNAENDGLKMWLKLDAAPREFDTLEAVRPVLGTVNKMAADSFRQMTESDFENVYVEFLGTAKDDMAVLLIIPRDGFDEMLTGLKEFGFSRAGVTFLDVPSDVISKNRAKIDELQKECLKAGAVTDGLAGEYENLNIVGDYFNTRLEREQAYENFVKTDSVVMIEGWVPEDEEKLLSDLIAKVCKDEFYLESENVDKDSGEAPVKLKNNRFVSAFEDVTSMYATPKYGEIDPTPLFAPFYWFFFGFMVGDTGYGLVLAVGTFLALRFFNLKDGMRKFLTFFFYLSFAVIAAGFVYGSFFGFTFFAPIAIRDAAGEIIGSKPLLDTQLDIPVMLIISVSIGVVQVIFGLLVKGYLLIRDGHILDAVFDSLFWIITLLGGICWLVGVTGAIPPAAVNTGKWLFIGGIIGLALTQGRSGKSLIGKIGTSLWEVYGITGYVGDLVSYTRIVALGLSGAFIAFSFIKMASILPPGPVGVVLGFIIIFLGQTLDFGLGLLGAYVHTCRLQYVEFFGKFFEGGGIPFKPLKCRNEFIHITK